VYLFRCFWCLIFLSYIHSGHAKEEPGAIVCRAAPSFLRFGSYEIHASRGKEDLEIVRRLADYTIRHHYPHLENMKKSEGLSFDAAIGDSPAIDLTSNKYAGKYLLVIFYFLSVFSSIIWRTKLSSFAICL